MTSINSPKPSLTRLRPIRSLTTPSNPSRRSIQSAKLRPKWDVVVASRAVQRAKKLSEKERSESAKKAALARWAKRR